MLMFLKKRGYDKQNMYIFRLVYIYFNAMASRSFLICAPFDEKDMTRQVSVIQVFPSSLFYFILILISLEKTNKQRGNKNKKKQQKQLNRLKKVNKF